VIFLRDDIQPLFSGKTHVDDFLDIDGEVVKQVVRSRRTVRLSRGSKNFYLKAHSGVGWVEIIKNLLSLHSPVVSALNEVRAIERCQAIGIDTTRLAAYGQEGINPATVKSFLLTDAIDATEDLEHWLPKLEQAIKREPRLITLKRAVITRVADIAAKLHGHGMNHRDFYLCHFRIALPPDGGFPEAAQVKIYLMDLHRAQRRRQIPHRWRVKDLAGLLYSSLFDARGFHLSGTDVARFMVRYSGQGFSRSTLDQKTLWCDVLRRVDRTHRRDHDTAPRLPPLLTRFYRCC
jgi:hypothetical protein